MASLPCPIELEPKTLNPLQINHARELAVVIQKIEPQGTPNDLFLQGLEEVVVNQSLERMEKIANPNNMVDQSEKVMIIDNVNMKETSHNCLCTDLFIDSPDTIITQKQPLSAPF